MSGWWPFRRYTEKPSGSAQLELLTERVEGLEKGLRGIRRDMEELQEEVSRRLGKIWGRLKGVKNDGGTPEGPDGQVESVPHVVSQHELLQAHRRRRGLLSR